MATAAVAASPSPSAPDAKSKPDANAGSSAGSGGSGGAGAGAGAAVYSYRDDWVQSKTIFALMSASECACCGFSVSSLALSDLMSACSDLETTTAADSGLDTKRQPLVSSANVSEVGVWPIFVTEKVWSDRVALRQRLKQRSAHYSKVWSEHGIALNNWWCSSQSLLSPSIKRALCCVPLASLHRSFQSEYGLGDAYTTVLIAVSEQIEQFDQTGYGVDGVSESEIAFERAIDSYELPASSAAGGNKASSDPIPCFGLSDEYIQHTVTTASSQSPLAAIFVRLTESSALHLLPKPVKTKKPIIPYYPPGTTAPPPPASATLASDAVPATTAKSAPSAAAKSSTRSGFRADRRLVRLMLYRALIDQIFAAFQKLNPTTTTSASSVTSPVTTLSTPPVAAVSDLKSLSK